MDWIETFTEATKNVPSPEIFRLWSAISCVSGVLERKVWTEGEIGPIFPHLYTVLVGLPSSGKTNAIRLAHDMWQKMNGLHVAPDNVTREALVDALSRSLRTIINGGDSAYTFSALNIACSEFGVFFMNHDLGFLSLMNHLYDSQSNHREERRTKGAIEIIRPHLVLLAGVQPDYLGTFLPEAAWGMGFTARLIMIYSAPIRKKSFFLSKPWLTPALVDELKRIFALKGEFRWTDAAVAEQMAWIEAGCPPQPTHNRLSHYAGRRDLLVAKLSMISAASNSSALEVTVDDWERAKDWLLEAEKFMPDIFHAMTQRSDAQVIADLHMALYREWSKLAVSKRKPVPTAFLWTYLGDRVTSERIGRIIDAAETMGRIRKGRFPDEWIPAPLGDFISDSNL